MPLEQLAQRFLVCGIGVGVQQAHGDRGVTAGAESRDEVALDLGRIEGSSHAAIGQHALVDLVAIAPIDDGRRLLIGEVVDVGPVVPLQRQDVLESARRDEGDRIALAFEHGVCRHGRAVRQILDRLKRNAAFNQRVEGAFVRARRYARHLRDLNARWANCHQVGECSADLDTHSHRIRLPRSSLPLCCGRVLSPGAKRERPGAIRRPVRP